MLECSPLRGSHLTRWLALPFVGARRFLFFHRLNLWNLWKTASGQNLLSRQSLLADAGTIQHFLERCSLPQLLLALM